MSNRPFTPANKVIVVTGGAKGIGVALCKAFAEAGAATVVVADINLDQAKHECREYSSTYDTRFIARHVNVASDASVAELIQWVETNVGPIDLFACNAGIMPHRSNPEMTGETAASGKFASDAEWKRVIYINTMQLVSVARYLIPRYLSRGRGFFLITASAAGFCPIGSVSYSVSKAAAVNFGEWLSVTYGNRGIDICLLCPQRTKTEMSRGFTGEQGAWLGRMIEPDEVASCCLDALKEGRIHCFPHPEVQTFINRKAENIDRWIRGMRRLNESVTYSEDGQQPAHLSKL
mmetsp:Transcript_26567/g.57642  ORF Transcript_26567/g.57642 Transcript_26567/m.57642 type:complete len:291 (+) Transcript_26567:137-1009(+)